MPSVLKLTFELDHSILIKWTHIFCVEKLSFYLVKIKIRVIYVLFSFLSFVFEEENIFSFSNIIEDEEVESE